MGVVLAGRLEFGGQARGLDRLSDEREVALPQLGLTAAVIVQARAELGVEAGDGLVAAALRVAAATRSMARPPSWELT